MRSRWHDYPKSLEEYYVQRLRRVRAVRDARLAAVDSPARARRYVARARRLVRRCFGPLPDRTPLKTRSWGISDWGGFLVERLTFESRPGFMVTANLYLPGTIEAPLPGVLFPCGHSQEGKAHPLYVKACIRLAREGYAVLIYDPVNQGERDLYANRDTGGRLGRNKPTAGHNVVGLQLQACGQWLGTWRLWDGIRALDCLAARPEVDAARLMVTGQSGGGTLSAFLWAMEPRLRAVASSCWTTRYLHDIENSMPADAEQYPPGFLAAGLDKIDFFMARAGEPALLLGQEYDFFDDRGLRESHAELRRLHRLMGGKPSDCRLAIDRSEHSYSDRNQLAMLSFFNRVAGKSRPAPDAPMPLEGPGHSWPPGDLEERLRVTSRGDVFWEGSRAMPVLIAADARRAASRRPRIPLSGLPAAVARCLAVAPPRRAPPYRRLLKTVRPVAGGGLWVSRFMVESEPGIACVLRRVSPEPKPFRLDPGRRARLYLPHFDSQSEIERAAAMADAPDFWMFEPRGIGEGCYAGDDPSWIYRHEAMMSGHALMLNEPLLGRRVFDVLGAVALLRAEGAREIALLGRGQGGILALLAALLDHRVEGVAVRETPGGFLALATAPFTLWHAANLPANVLNVFDLPEVRAALGRRLKKDEAPADPVEFPS